MLNLTAEMHCLNVKKLVLWSGENHLNFHTLGSLICKKRWTSTSKIPPILAFYRSKNSPWLTCCGMTVIYLNRVLTSRPYSKHTYWEITTADMENSTTGLNHLRYFVFNEGIIVAIFYWKKTFQAVVLKNMYPIVS